MLNKYNQIVVFYLAGEDFILCKRPRYSGVCGSAKEEEKKGRLSYETDCTYVDNTSVCYSGMGCREHYGCHRWGTKRGYYQLGNSR
jgi:hypothetical protein